MNEELEKEMGEMESKTRNRGGNGGRQCDGRKLTEMKHFEKKSQRRDEK